MSNNKNYIFINDETRQWFHSAVMDPVEGFTCLKYYRLAFDQWDAQSYDNDRQDLCDQGYSEVPSPQYYYVELYYMKESGKFYSSGTMAVNRGAADADPAKSWMEVMEQIRYKLDSGNLPGLVKGSRFEVFVTGSEHPGGYPACFRINN